MSSVADILKQAMITRADLNAIKGIKEEEERKRGVAIDVGHMRQMICNLAMTSDKKTLFRPYNCGPPTPENPRYRNVTDILDALKTVFPDVDIEFKSQICLQTGKYLNQGFYIDWT